MKAKTKKTVTIAGLRYAHKMCGNKGAMKARAVSARKNGKKARVVKVGTRYCLYTR